MWSPGRIDRQVWGLGLGGGLLLVLAMAARRVLADPAHSAWLPAMLCRPGAPGAAAWSVGAAAAAGLAFGFGHCLGMCGPFVLGYALGLPAHSARRGWAHLRYSLGRTTTYAAIGTIAGLLGASAQRGGSWLGVQGAFSGVAGGLLVVLGLGMLVGRSFEPTGILGAWAAAWKKPFARAVAQGATFRIGLLNGLLPCGMVASGAAMALATGSAPAGALTMAAFGLGTAPAMWLLGVHAGRLQAPLAAFLRRLGAWVMLATGLWVMVRPA